MTLERKFFFFNRQVQKMDIVFERRVFAQKAMKQERNNMRKE